MASLAGSPLIIRLIGCWLTGLGELEAASTATGDGSSVTTDGHRLAAAVTTSPHVSGPLEGRSLGSLGCRRCAGCRLIIR